MSNNHNSTFELSNEQVGILNAQLEDIKDPLFNYGISFKVKSDSNISTLISSLANCIPILTAKLHDNSSIELTHNLDFNSIEIADYNLVDAAINA